MEGEGEKRDGYLEGREVLKSPGMLLYKIGFASVFVAAPRDFKDSLNADDVLSGGLAHAPSRAMALFADKATKTVYAGNEEEVRRSYEGMGLSLVKVILDDNVEYTLLSIAERGGQFIFSVCPSDAPADAQMLTVEALNKFKPRSVL